MNATRRSTAVSSLQILLLRLAGPLAGRGRAVIIAAVVLVLCVAGSYAAWSSWGDHVKGDPRYALTVDRFQVTPQPAWIAADVTAEVVRDGSLKGLSLLDPAVTVKIKQAFALHTWVAKVHRVSKRANGKVVVELEYRQPAVMVETEGGYWPVDYDGVLLPPDAFSAEQTTQFLHVVALNSEPAGIAGTAFGDSGVQAAAEIARLLKDHWQTLNLRTIVVRDVVAGTALREPDLQFELLRADGSQVLWGNEIGQEAAGEPTASQKLHRLLQSPPAPSPLDLRVQ